MEQPESPVCEESQIIFNGSDGRKYQMIIVGGGGIGKEALTIKMQKVRDIIKEKPELKDIYYDFVFDDDDTKKSEEPIQNDTKKYFSSRYDPNAEQWDFPYNKIN